jgi:hypothetical protein
LVAFLTATLSSAQDVAPSGPKKPIRMYLGLVIPTYASDPNTLQNLHSGFSFNLGLKRTYNIMGAEFDIGLEYVNQTLSFDSYYFAQGYSVFYDKTYSFEHDLILYEFQLPVLYRKNFGNPSRKKTTSYFTIGWALRYFSYASTSIQDIPAGTQVFEGKTNLTFEYPFLSEHLGTLVQAGFGLQFNNHLTRKAIFVDLNYKFAVTRLNYTGVSNSNNLFIHDSNFTLTLGRKF